MGGGQRSTTTTENQFSPEQRRLQGLQADVASSILPGLQNFLLPILSGNTGAASGFARSAIAPQEAATQRAIEGILARTPRGGLQQQLVSQAQQQGAFARAQTEQDYIQRALAIAGALFNYNPPVQATTQTQRQSGGPQFGVALGPFSATF